MQEDHEEMTALARDSNFQSFVLTSSLSYLESCQARSAKLAVIAGR